MSALNQHTYSPEDQEVRSPTSVVQVENVARVIGRCEVSKLEMRQKWRECGGYLASLLESRDMTIGCQNSRFTLNGLKVWSHFTRLYHIKFFYEVKYRLMYRFFLWFIGRLPELDRSIFSSSVPLQTQYQNE